MFRRWAIAGGLVCGGVALAQPWPAVTADKASEPVYVMRTAGQNDRQLKLVRAADPADPASMATVKDTATGETFEIPGRVLAKLPKVGAKRTDVSAPPPLPADVEPPTTPVKTVIPPVEAKIVIPPVESKAVSPTIESKAVIQPLGPKTVTPPPTPTPVAAVRIERTENVQKVEAVTPSLRPAQVVSPVTELPVVASPVPRPVPQPQTPLLPNDPWRATGEGKAVAPTPPPPAAGPRLTPVPTWRATPQPTLPGVNDPWRPSGS